MARRSFTLSRANEGAKGCSIARRIGKLLRGANSSPRAARSPPSEADDTGGLDAACPVMNIRPVPLSATKVEEVLALATVIAF
jgi:hypothetical protein